MASRLVDLTNTLQSQSPSAEAETLITSKLDLLNTLAEKMVLSAANPAPKETIHLSNPQGYTDPIFIEGIIAGSEMAGLPYGSELTTVWQARTDAGYLQIGAGSSADHPGQGVIYVQEISQEKAIINATIIITDEFDGKLEILADTPDGIILQSASGSQYFFNFDTYTLEVLN